MRQSCKAFLAILLMIAMMLPVMVSCGKDTVEEETTAEIVTEAPVPEEIGPQKIYLVRPKEASEQVLRLVNGAAALIEEKTKSAVEILTDTETAYEKKEDHFYVIFGETAYEQSKSLAASAQDNKMHYAATEDTVAVYAKTEQLLSIAAEKLFADCIKDGVFAVDASFNSLTLDGAAYVKENWTLHCPAVGGGRLDTTTYRAGYGIDQTKDMSQLQLIRLASSTLYTEYLKTLESIGYRKEMENEIDGNLYASYVGPLGTNIYVYFTKAKYEMRVIEDTVSTPLSKFNYEMSASGDTRLYAFKLDYKSEDCFLIHLADNSWIIIDGGYTGLTAKSAYVKDMYDFMVSKSGLKDGEKLVIACWYLTHVHSDHFGGMYGLVNDYGSKIEIKRIIDNAPVNGFFVMEHRFQYTTLLKKIKTYNPDVMYLKIHTGMQVQLADTKIEMLFTHEDIIAEYMSGSTTNANHSSLVAVFDIAGLTFLETGDNLVYNTYKDFKIETLTTDVLKIAHHYYDKTLDAIYKSLYETGKVSYCYNPRWDSTANATNNYQAPTKKLFGTRYLEGSASKIYEFYRNGANVVMNVINV